MAELTKWQQSLVLSGRLAAATLFVGFLNTILDDINNKDAPQLSHEVYVLGVLVKHANWYIQMLTDAINKAQAFDPNHVRTEWER